MPSDVTARRAWIRTPLEMPAEAAFDVLFVRSETAVGRDVREEHWAAKSLLALKADQFTALAIDRFQSRRVRLATGDHFVSGERGVTGRIFSTMDFFSAWNLPARFADDALCLTDAGRWHVVLRDDGVLTGLYLTNTEAVKRVRTVLSSIITDA